MIEYLTRCHEEAMPKKGKGLTTDEIALIELWIDTGAHWADAALKIFPEAEMALNRPALPENSTFSHPVDQLLDQYFQQQRIRWPARVNDETFIRRAYLDVTGLLPAPEAPVIPIMVDVAVNPGLLVWMLKGFVGQAFPHYPGHSQTGHQWTMPEPESSSPAAVES